MLDPFEAHPPTQAPDVDKLINHRGFCLRPHSYEGGVVLAEPNPITDRTMLRRSLDVRIPILLLLRYKSHDPTLVAFCLNRQCAVSYYHFA